MIDCGRPAGSSRQSPRNEARGALLTLTRAACADDLTLLRKDASRALASGAKIVRLEIEELAAIDDAAIGTLILILRHARERDANVVLVTARESVVAALRLTALDKIFTVEVAAAAS
jgi:anti-anti-sigma regulatory factor